MKKNTKKQINNDTDLESTRQIEELIKIEKYSKALEVVDSILNGDPNNHKMLCHKISILGLLKKHNEAISVANKVLKIDKDEWVFFQKGLNFYNLYKYADAAKAFDESLKIQPHNVKVILKKISALTLAGMHKEAVKLFESSDLPEPKNAILYNNIGYSLTKLKRYPEAMKFLQQAKTVCKFDNTDNTKEVIYGNLLRLYLLQKKYFKYLYCLLAYCFLPIRRKKRKISNTDKDIYRGSGALFSSNSQTREVCGIWKIFRTPIFSNLCNDWFNWFAVNIPLDLLGKNGFEGDIDLLISMPKNLPPDDKTGSKYRAFEVKSIPINKNGAVKSLKKGKHKKFISQLKKMHKFGCEQIFLLELYAIERGYSDNKNFPPKDIIDETNIKIDRIKNDDFGYVMVVDEPSPQYNDERGGIMHIPINILPAKENQIQAPFLDLVNYIDNFYNKEIENYTESGKFTAITYCSKCKKLIMLYVDDKNHQCPHCQKRIY